MASNTRYNRHEPLDVLVDFAVNVRDEQELLVPLDHETECTVPRSSWALARSGIKGGSSSGSALALAGPAMGKSTTRWLWLIAFSLALGLSLQVGTRGFADAQLF